MSKQSAQGETVAERIRDLFESLTRAERQLADAILENYPVSGMGSITAVAKRADVSTPTVARMARKLAYDGFPQMQGALRSEVEATISSPIAKHDHWAQHAPDTHILNRFADAVRDNMRQSLRQIDPATFNAVTDLLCDETRDLYFVGGRITRPLADYFFTHMQVIRPGVTAITPNANSWPHYVLNMKKGDILIAFDIRRYEHNIMRLARMAAARDVKLILFTDQWGSPALKHAAHTFRSRIEVPSPWDSSVVTMFIIEALIAAVHNNNWDANKERLKTLEDLFDETRLFKKFV